MSDTSTTEAPGKTASAIARALGGGASSGGWYRARCPVHHSKSLSLALKDGLSGLLVKCHAGCSRAEVVTELMRCGMTVGTTPTAPDPVALERQRKRDAVNRLRRVNLAEDIWLQTVDADETYVKPYLWSRLCISDDYAPSVHFQRWLYHRETRSNQPAMACLVEHVELGAVAVHATYLRLDDCFLARKAPIKPVRKTFGLIDGGAVRLGEAGENLVVGEGIETVLSVSLSLGIPGWAALSAGNLQKLVLPPEARLIYLAADNDIAGQKAALAAADRWRRDGREVAVAWPPEPGTDFNDVLMAAGPSYLEAANG